MGINPNTFSNVTNSVLSRSEGDDRSMGFSGSEGLGFVSCCIARDRTWKFRAMRLQGIKVRRRRILVLSTGTEMPRMVKLQESWWPGVKRQRKRTSPRSRRDHAKYKEGSERKVQRLKGRSVTPCVTQDEREGTKCKWTMPTLSFMMRSRSWRFRTYTKEVNTLAEAHRMPGPVQRSAT